MNNGVINVGSRRPVNVPEWVTLEVVTGGFATGKYLAGGEIQDFETNLIKKFGLVASRENVRKTLNTYFLTEDGLNQLFKLYFSGCYKINIPEEGALLKIAWLLSKNLLSPVVKIIDEILPYMDILRF